MNDPVIIVAHPERLDRVAAIVVVARDSMVVEERDALSGQVHARHHIDLLDPATEVILAILGALGYAASHDVRAVRAAIRREHRLDVLGDHQRELVEAVVAVKVALAEVEAQRDFDA